MTIHLFLVETGITQQMTPWSTISSPFKVLHASGTHKFKPRVSVT